MTTGRLPQVAVIADAHFHDMRADFGLERGFDPPAFRRLAETLRASRLTNESAAALRWVLDDILSRGIIHVVLLGDYSDDGQIANLATLDRLLAAYRGRGLRFYATPGNHDIFGLTGRHRARRFAAGNGYDLVTSDPGARDPEARRIWISSQMYCPGYPAGLRALTAVGFDRQPHDLHWERPGLPMDASYLVEPAQGLWLMMIDANVFEQVGTGFSDPTNVGWNAMGRVKPAVLRWMANVAQRARAGGKRLVTMSHYPVLDPFGGAVEDEVALLGEGARDRRIPTKATGRAILEAGIGLHLGGHLHVNATTHFEDRGRSLVDIAVPSLVRWPAGYKILRFESEVVEVETVVLDAMPLDPLVLDAYRAEPAAALPEAQRVLAAQDYGVLLWEHMGHIVGRRHLKRDWPLALANEIRGASLSELARQRLPGPQVTGLEFLADWHRLKAGGDLAHARLPAGRLDVYRSIEPCGRFGPLFAALQKFLARPPARNFAVNPDQGDVIAR